MKHYRSKTKLLNEEELIDTFLNLFDYWWTSPENGLFNKRKEAKAALMHLVQTGKEPDGIHWTMVYVIGKFEKDFLPHFEEIDEAYVVTRNYL